MVGTGVVVAAIGFIGNTLSPFMPDSSTLRPTSDPRAARVRIHAGLARANDKQHSTGGDAPDIDLWDGSGAYFGYTMAKSMRTSARLKIGDGGWHDYTVKDIKGGPALRTPEYISVINGGANGLCIAAISVLPPGRNDGFTWFGDVGFACGAPWYAQDTVMGSDGHRPKCVWIDANGGSGHLYKGLSVHMPSFSPPVASAGALAQQWNASLDLVCRSEPRFSMYENIILENTVRVFNAPLQVADNGTDADRDQILDAHLWTLGERPFDPMTRCPAQQPCGATGASAGHDLERQLPSRVMSKRHLAPAAADELVVSHLAGSDAAELCGSPHSVGPDFVSTAEGLFCDMSTKQLWPLCTPTAGDSCFDLEAHMMRDDHGHLVASEATHHDLVRRDGGATTWMSRRYHAVRTWGSA